MSITILIGIGVTIFIGCTLIFVAVSSSGHSVEQRLREVVEIHQQNPRIVEDEDAEQKQSPLAYISSFLHPITESLGLAANVSVANNLAKIGYDAPYYQDMYYAAKVVGPMIAAVIAGTLLKSDPLFAFFALGSLAFFLPDLWLSSRVSRWREAIRLSLPDALDLLVITMEAGLGLDQALLRVATEMKPTHPELSGEFNRINLEQRAGKRRLEAWHHMADRTELDVIRAFVNMLLQTERFGTPIASSLGHFAESLRTRRRQQAEEMAAKTTVKLVFPLVLFIFPSMFIVLLAPAIISIVEGLGKQIQ